MLLQMLARRFSLVAGKGLIPWGPYTLGALHLGGPYTLGGMFEGLLYTVKSVLFILGYTFGYCSESPTAERTKTVFIHISNIETQR